MSDKINKNILFDGLILELELKNTKKKNAITEKMLDDLLVILKNKALLKKYKLLTIKGFGNGPFSSGADLQHINSKSKDLNLYHNKLFSVMETLNKVNLPKIALVNSYCFGAGLFIALQTDIILAKKNAIFCIPAMKLNLKIPGKQLQNIKKKISNQLFYNDIIFSSRKFNAKEALGSNLISHIIDSSNTNNYYKKYIKNIASRKKNVIQYYLKS